MRYFINEAERKASRSSCYLEFQKGRYHGECWLRDSISISDEEWDSLGLSELVAGVIEDFDRCGITVVTKEQWGEIVKRSKEDGPQQREAIAEAVPWAEACFREYDVFTILGI